MYGLPPVVLLCAPRKSLKLGSQSFKSSINIVVHNYRPICALIPFVHCQRTHTAHVDKSDLLNLKLCYIPRTIYLLNDLVSLIIIQQISAAQEGPCRLVHFHIYKPRVVTDLWALFVCAATQYTEIPAAPPYSLRTTFSGPYRVVEF